MAYTLCKEDLIDLHHTKLNTLKEISKIIGVSDTTIGKYVNQYNIHVIQFPLISSVKKELKSFQNLLDNTKFLTDVKDNERLYCFQHNITSIPTCPSCNTNTKFHGKSSGYAKYCSSTCRHNSPERHAQIKKTNIEKYGVENPFQNEQIKKKIKKSNLEKYGVENPAQSEEIYNKVKKTNIEKYGVEYSFQNKEIQDKIKVTNLEKYGVEYPAQFQEIHNKNIITNLEKFNVNWMNQHPLTPSQQEKLNNKNWLQDRHHNKKLTLVEIGKMLSVRDSTVGRYLRSHNIEIKRFAVSSQERKLYDELSNFNIPIIQNTRDIISPLELDLYFPDHNLAIEINGLYWHNEDHKDQMYHENKRLLCEEKGITLLQFWDYEIDNNFDLIVSMIKNHCKLNTDKRIYARKCKVVNISANKEFVSSFLDKNHIQGSTSITVCFGLEYENKIISLMGFNKSNLKQYDYNLVRFCSLRNYSVIGGASKLLKQMSKFKLVSYSDGRYSNGGLYETLGFKNIKVNTPDYKYTLDFKTLHHKFAFRRKSIKSKFPEYYSPDLTEKEMMYNIGYKRVYGCSIKTWIM